MAGLFAADAWLTVADCLYSHEIRISPFTWFPLNSLLQAQRINNESDKSLNYG